MALRLNDRKLNLKPNHDAKKSQTLLMSIRAKICWKRWCRRQGYSGCNCTPQIL